MKTSVADDSAYEQARNMHSQQLVTRKLDAGGK